MLVLDEPTASLDFGNQALVLREIPFASGGGPRYRPLDPRSQPRLRLRHRGRSPAPRHAAGDRRTGPVIEPARLDEVYGIGVSIARLPDGLLLCAPDLA